MPHFCFTDSHRILQAKEALQLIRKVLKLNSCSHRQHVICEIKLALCVKAAKEIIIFGSKIPGENKVQVKIVPPVARADADGVPHKIAGEQVAKGAALH